MTLTLPEIVQQFPLVQPQTVAWGDMDAFAHVNNATYYRYFESVRISYLQAIGALDDLQDGNPVVAANSCRFLKPITYPDQLQLAARVVELRQSGFRMEYVIYSAQQQAVVAIGDAVVVMVDRHGAKAALSAALRAAIVRVEATVGHELS